jgi:phosphoglycolate phosphatase
MPRYSDVIFDFDGTLVDSAPAILATFSAVLRSNGIPPAVDVGEHLIGPPLAATLRKLTGITDENVIHRLVDDFKASYDRDGVFSTTIYPGVEELLSTLHERGRSMIIATNKRQRPTQLLIEHFGWTPYFRAIYCTDTRQPSFGSKNEMLATLLAERSLSAPHAAFVGDTQPDADAARENGVDFFAARWGYGEWSSQEVAAADDALSLRDLLLGKATS